MDEWTCILSGIPLVCGPLLLTLESETTAGSDAERLCPIMFLIYSLFFTVGVILAAPYYLWRLRGHILSGSDWRERFGFLPDSLQQTAVPRQASGPAGPPAFGSRSPGAIWIHAVSVGE